MVPDTGCPDKHGKSTIVTVCADYRIHIANWIMTSEIDRKIVVAAIRFLLVQNKQQTHD